MLKVKPILLSKHRMNLLEGMATIPAGVGAEIDLRTLGKEIILSHDPFLDGPRLRDWLRLYGEDRKGPLLLNVKEDTLETAAVQLCEEAGIRNYFFVDVSFPTMRRLAESGFPRLSIRISEYEPITLAKAFQGKIEWAWVDCFTGREPERETITQLQEMGFRVALVSPEIHGYSEEVVRQHFNTLYYLRPGIDLVCTKRPDLWGENLLDA